MTTKFRFDKLTEEQRVLLLGFPDADVSEIKHVLKTGISSRPKCLVCEKPASWSNTRKKYGSFCSKDCAFSPRGLEFSKETAKQTCLQKYGVEHSSQNAEVRQRISQAHLDNPVTRIPFIDTLTAEQRAALAPFIDASVAEMKHVLANQLTARPPCAVCGSPTHFKDTLKAYTKFCGESCRRSPEGRQIERDVSRRTSLERYGVEHPFAADTVKAAIKQTCQERYGADSYTGSKDFSDKKQQWLEEHGVTNVMQIKEVRDKFVDSLMKNTPERVEKIRSTCLERYGVKNVAQNPEIAEKMQRTATRNRWPKFIESLKKRQLIPCFEIDDLLDRERPVMFHCERCGLDFERRKTHNEMKYIVCPDCSRKFGSFAEQEIYDWAATLGEKIAMHHRRSVDGVMKEIDFFFPDHNLGIEYHGLWHHSEACKDKNYHREKALFFAEQGVRVLQIWEHEWTFKREIVQSVILNALKKTEQLMARKCEIVQLSGEEARSFMEENHLQGNSHGSVRFGLQHEGELVAALVLGKPRFDKGYEWEILRFANKRGKRVAGGFTRLWSEFVRQRNPQTCLSYRDLRFFHDGKSLEAAGFVEKMKTGPGYFYFNILKNVGLVTVSRFEAQKHKLNDLLGENFDPAASEHENMLNNDWLRVYDAGQAVHVWRSSPQ